MPSLRPNFILRGARLATIDGQLADQLLGLVGRLDAGEHVARARAFADVERQPQQLGRAFDALGSRRSCAMRRSTLAKSSILMAGAIGSPPACRGAVRAPPPAGAAAATRRRRGSNSASSCFGSTRCIRCV